MSGIADRLNKLRAKSTQKEAEKPSKKKRPIVSLDSNSRELFLKLSKAKTVLDAIDSQHKTLSALLKKKVMENYTVIMHREKMQPENPSIQVKDSNDKLLSEGIFQVKEKIKINADDLEADLLAIGFNQETVDTIIEENIEEVGEINLTPLHELAFGKVTKNEKTEPTPVQTKLAEKVVAFLEKLSKEEYAELVSEKDTVVVRAGILDRLPRYCSTTEELQKLLTIFSPELAISGIKFAKDNPNRGPMLLDICKEIIGV